MAKAIFNMPIQVERGHASLDTNALRDYCDGSMYKTHPLLSVHTKGLQFFLYTDDEVCNPLGSSRTKHKLVSFKVLNKRIVGSMCQRTYDIRFQVERSKQTHTSSAYVYCHVCRLSCTSTCTQEFSTFHLVIFIPSTARG